MTTDYIINPGATPDWREDGLGELAGPAVLQRFDNCQAYADNAFDVALAYINSMQLTTNEEFNSTLQALPDVPEPNLTPKDIVAPAAPDTSMNIVSAPNSIEIEDITIDAISGIPSFDVPTLTISLPAQPTMPTNIDPGEPDAINNIELPANPIYALPSLPTLKEAQIPDPPSLTMPTFEGTMPVDDLIMPTNTFNFSEERYASDLLDAAKAKLKADVENGGAGLGAVVENAIWTREQERDELALEEAKDRTAAEWSERGFPLPDGVLTSMLQELEKTYTNTRLTTSKDISIKQAEMALQNTQFAVQQAIALEGQLITYSSQIAERQLQSAKHLIDASIAIFNAAVVKYNAKLDAYKTQAAVYESKIRAALAQTEIYRNQIEAQKLTLDMDNALVELYKAQLAGVEQLINCYRAEMEGAKIRTDVERLKLEAYKSKVEAYIAKINLNVAQFNCYDSAIRGETAKAQIYASQVDAYRARVESVKIEASIATEKAQVKSEIQKNRAAIYATDVEAYKAKIETEKTRIMAIIEAYQGQIEGYKAESTVDANRIESETKSFVARIQRAMVLGEIYIKEADISLQAFTEKQKLKGVLVEAGSRVASQLAASAMAATNASLSFGESDGKHKSYSTSNSYSASDSTSFSRSRSESNSESNSTSHNYNYDL